MINTVQERESVVTEEVPLKRWSGKAALRQHGIYLVLNTCSLLLLFFALKRDLNHFSRGDTEALTVTDWVRS